MRRSKKALAAGITTVAVAVGGGTASAVGPLGDGDGFLAGVASRLGIEQSKLEEAIRDTRADRIDELEADGRLSEEQADRMRERLESGGPPPLGPGGFHGGPGFHAHRVGPGGFLEPAAEALGLSAEELRERLPGTSLAELAEEEGVPVAKVRDAIVAAERERLDEAVSNGWLDEEEAAEMRERIGDRVADLMERELPEAGWFRHRRPPAGEHEKERGDGDAAASFRIS